MSRGGCARTPLPSGDVVRERIAVPDRHRRRWDDEDRARSGRGECRRDGPEERLPNRRAAARAHHEQPRLLAVFTFAMLLIVGLATLAAVVDRMWILAPVMAIDLTVTGLVITTIARLLNDGDDG